MKSTILALTLILSISLQAQSVLGKWKTIDDVTGKAKSIVEIYEQDGKVFGKVVKILTPGRENAVCDKCEGVNKDKPILGLIILKNLTKDGDEWEDGEILDPNNGKTYSCYITLEDKDKLKVRGYIGFSVIGRTQYWYRVKE
jgi:uncharacterized protein (DUF2147 family)